MRIFPQLHFLELHFQGVEKEKTSDEGITDSENKFHGLNGLKNPDDAREDSKNATFSATGYAAGRGRFGVEATVAGTFFSPEYGALALEAEDGSVHIGFAQKNACVVHEIAGRKVVSTVHHHIVVSEKFECVVGTQGDFVGYYVHVGIEFGNGAPGRFNLGLTDGGLTVDNLTLEVGFVHPVEINDSKSTYPCGG
jgi:hypothetical protein